MTRRLLVLVLPAMLAVGALAHAEAIPGAPGTTPGTTPGPAPAATVAPAPPPAAAPFSWTLSEVSGQRFVAIAVGAAVGALMPQVTAVDGLVLMSAIMGGMIGDMAYNSAGGTVRRK